jgi:hypothetical protein
MSDFLRRNLHFSLGRHEFATKRFGEDALVELLDLAGGFLQAGFEAVGQRQQFTSPPVITRCSSSVGSPIAYSATVVLVT